MQLNRMDRPCGDLPGRGLDSRLGPWTLAEAAGVEGVRLKECRGLVVQCFMWKEVP